MNMKKYFKSKRNKNNKYKYLIIILLIIFIDINIIKYINLNYPIENIKYSYNIDRDKLLLKLGLNKVFEDNKNINDSIPVFNKINKNNIYLYNTHYYEEYIDGNVVDATNYLTNKLKDYDIDVIYNSVNLLNNSNYNYDNSYDITREYLINVLSDDIKLYIDIHRDSGEKSKFTLIKDNISYAKVLFVIGENNSHYKDNLSVANNISEMLNNKVYGISKGIFTRSKGRYNQDLNKNIILIEIGCENNDIKEVYNTLDVLAEIVSVYINNGE